MEPLHITEFASKRYYEKLEQLPKEHEQQQQAEGHVVVDKASTFILPIRQAEHQAPELPWHGEHQRLEKKEKEKGRLFGRLRASKASASASESQPLRRPSVGSITSSNPLRESPAVKRKSLPFDQLFLNLPTELQIQIVASLPLSDVLNLRLASRSWHGMVTLNEVPIVRYQLEHAVPAYAKRLYPITDASGYSLHYLCGLWHRLHVAAKLSGRMCDWCTKEIFLRTTKDQVAAFAGQRERMYRRLVPLLFTIYHFFENYRKLHTQYIQQHGYGLERTPYTLNPLEVQIMDMYDNRTLLKAHQVFPMVVASFCRQLRPPSYVGRLERTVRGYLREKPADEVHAAVLCLGGLRQVLRLWEIKGYNTRVGTVDAWYGDIRPPTTKKATRPPPVTASSKDSTKPSRGIMGLGRRKSTWQIQQQNAALAGDSTETAPPPPPPPPPPPALPGRASLERTVSRASTTCHGAAPAPAPPPPPAASLVFHTSLAAGMPMGRLEPEQYHALLGDLPALQRVWIMTAEALILDRRIVERSVDIKRNAQVMLDLIKEDGVAEEDVWWYGVTNESIRPLGAGAIEEDVLE